MPRAKKTAASSKPRSPEDLAELESRINAYFDGCDGAGKLYGEAGLALGLGISMNTLRRWYDGTQRPGFAETVQRAYLRIQDQVETHPAYQEKGGMTSRAIFLLKQARFGGYQDKIEAKQDLAVNVKFGGGMNETDFK